MNRQSSEQNTDQTAAEQAHRRVMFGNGVLAALKLGAGGLSGSALILADGLHSLADLAVGGLIWLGYRAAQRPPDDDHHYGHGKSEGLVALAVGGALLWAGVEVAHQAILSSPPAYAGAQLWGAMGAAVVSLILNEWLARKTLLVAIAVDSPGLRALVRDKRSDALTSIVALIGLAAGALGMTWAEPAGTAVIGGCILLMGLASLREGLDILTDRVADPALRERATEVAAGVEGVCEVPLVRFHPLGSRYRVDIEICVDGKLSVRKGHEISHSVEDEVTRVMDEVVQVTIHVSPSENGSSRDS
ncbi:MAG: cation diffusion facilitator family transporter [Planctomycetota bacterium]|jgi:cation diffusion facilitator family transporter